MTYCYSHKPSNPLEINDTVTIVATSYPTTPAQIPSFEITTPGPSNTLVSVIKQNCNFQYSTTYINSSVLSALLTRSDSSCL